MGFENVRIKRRLPPTLEECLEKDSPREVEVSVSREPKVHEAAFVVEYQRPAA